MAGDFNRIPPQCVGICDLDQAAVDRNGIILTRNCIGPTPSEGRVDSRVTVRSGEVMEIDPTVRYTSGRVACRNAGLIEWLDTKEEAFKEGA